MIKAHDKEDKDEHWIGNICKITTSYAYTVTCGYSRVFVYSQLLDYLDSLI